MPGPKRFYRAAEAAARDGGFTILLDGKPVKTLSAASFLVPTRKLAEAIAAEWAAQKKTIEAATMPLWVLACRARDDVAPARERTVDDVAGFARTDLLCYRATHPEDLIVRQRDCWQPLLDWVARECDAPLKVTAGIVFEAQPEGALAALRRAVAAHDDHRLAALAQAARASGSLVLALALSKGRITGAQAVELSLLDELYQIEKWGDDPEAQARRETVRADVLAAEHFMALAAP
jgi:chaperone required for assembly of F1-ATPase